MPPEASAPEGIVQPYHDALASLADPATDAEAIALLPVLPHGEDSLFGLAWSVLHFIETAPSWPIRDALDDRSWWVTFLRERADRGNQL